MCPVWGCLPGPVGLFQLFFCVVFPLRVSLAEGSKDVFFVTPKVIPSRAAGKALISPIKSSGLGQNKMNAGYQAASISCKVFTGTGLKCNPN